MRIYLVLALVAFSTAQKHHKGKHPKSQYIAASPGPNSGEYYGGSSQYDGPSSYPQQAPKHQPSYHGGSSAPNAKQNYPLLLSDTRTLNDDGTINYNFQADNGLQQGETVDPDGTRRGFYSYPGADGKLITVKYTAGKNGFVAEGDHLPLQPQSAPHSDKDNDEEYVHVPKPKKTHRPQGHHGGSSGSGHYSQPSGPSYHQGGPSPSYNHRPAAPQSHYSHGPAPSRGHYQGAPKPAPRPSHSQYEGPSSHYQGRPESGSFAGFGGDDGFPQGFASPQTNFNNYAGAPKSHSGGRQGGNKYTLGGPSHAPSYSSGASAPFAGGNGGRGGYTANNPYQGGAGPYDAKFDLGNGGHYSINFTPGAAQEYQPEGPSYSPSQATASYAGVRPYPGPKGPPRGTRGQY